MIDKLDKTQCTGCKMCGDICPKSAISFETDEEGFWYPSIDYTKCIKCNICEKKCPSLNTFEGSDNLPEVFAAWCIEDSIRLNSTSGGAFWVIAKKFMEDGGMVAGCRYKEDWRSAEHILAHNEEELRKIMGSKYFQSDTAGIYQAVKEALENGKKVLFCGTPCQNAALKSYLGNKTGNIYFMDFISINYCTNLTIFFNYKY